MTDLDLARYFARHLLERGPSVPTREAASGKCFHCGVTEHYNSATKTAGYPHWPECTWPRIEAEARRVLGDEGEGL